MEQEKLFEMVCLGNKDDMSAKDIEEWVNDVLSLKGRDWFVSSGVWEHEGSLYINLTKSKNYNRYDLIKNTMDLIR